MPWTGVYPSLLAAVCAVRSDVAEMVEDSAADPVENAAAVREALEALGVDRPVGELASSEFREWDFRDADYLYRIVECELLEEKEEGGTR